MKIKQSQQTVGTESMKASKQENFIKKNSKNELKNHWISKTIYT